MKRYLTPITNCVKSLALDMEKNVGHFDRIARLALGPVLLILGGLAATGAFALGSPPTWAVLLAGVVLVVTGITQRCVINEALGIDTYRGDTEPVDRWRDTSGK